MAIMNIEDFRAFVLSLGDVEEKMPFGKFARRYESTLVFYVCGHMFCLCDIDDFTVVNFRSTHDEISDIQALYPQYERPYNQAMKLWLGLPLDGSVPEAAVKHHVARAYEIIRDKYTPRGKKCTHLGPGSANSRHKPPLSYEKNS